MTDNDIINYFFVSSKGTTQRGIIPRKMNNIPDDIVMYLHSRFLDSTDDDSLSELIYRVKNKIDVLPTCPICGGKLKYWQKGQYGKVCGNVCAGKMSNIKVREKYGVTSLLLLPEVKVKSQEAIFKKYNVTNVSQAQEIKDKKEQSFLERHGIRNNFGNKDVLDKAIKNSHTDEANEKRKKTNNEKYNVDYFLSTLKGKKLSPEHAKKLKNIVNTPEFQKRRHNTMKEHNSFCSHKYEDSFYEQLLNFFDDDDIIRDFNKDQRYPWKADFYIISRDIFIEVQGSQFHHGHPFDSTNDDDIKELDRLISLATDDHPQYGAIINTWVNKDIVKRETAIDNKLNFIEVWPTDEHNDIVKRIYEGTLLKTI